MNWKPYLWNQFFSYTLVAKTSIKHAVEVMDIEVHIALIICQNKENVKGLAA